MRVLNLILVFLVTKLVGVSSYNIFAIFPLASKSHFFTVLPILKGLASKGHNVTVLGYYPLQEKVKNYHDILVGEPTYVRMKPKADKGTTYSNEDRRGRMILYSKTYELSQFGQEACEMLLESVEVRTFMNRTEKFDLMITEHFITDSMLVLAKKFNCHVVRIHTTTMFTWTYQRYGNPLNPAYIPSNFLLFSNKMSFFERVENTLVTIIQNIFMNVIMVQAENDLIESHFGEKYATMHKDIYEDSILLLNTHFTVSHPIPLVPNVIEIGGIHIGDSHPLSVVSQFHICVI